jgi:crossover junction endodeoxyribonuclease RusA
MLPLEFVVFGKPVSHQTHNKTLLQHWQSQVRTGARAVWGDAEPIANQNLLLKLTYYAQTSHGLPDTDNFAKPIQDALIGLAYQDDRLVTDLHIRRASRTDAAHITDASALFIEALSQPGDFVYVILTIAPSHQEIL